MERCCGAVRVAKDPQRLKNMLTSKLADIAGGSSVRKPIFTPRQVAGHTELWANDNVQNNPYLLINELIDPVSGQLIVAPVSYLEPATVPQPLGALLSTGAPPDPARMKETMLRYGLVAAGTALALMIASFVFVAEFAGAPPQSVYVPAHMEDGKLIPGSLK